MDDRLSFILRTPGVVEGVVREALRRALCARRHRGEPPDVRSFSNLALRVLERRTRDAGGSLDAVGRHELEAATLRAAAAFRSHDVTVGMCSVAVGSSRPFIAPQSEWPHTTISVTPSATQAYSTTADTPPSISP